MPIRAYEIHWEHSATDPQPVWLPGGEELPADSGYSLRPEGGGDPVVVQRMRDGRLVALLTPDSVRRRHELVGGSLPGCDVCVHHIDGDRIDLRVGQERFGEYLFSRSLARPFLYPVLGPGGVAVTRHFPMQDLEGEMHDHPHHRSFWTAYGEVNGVDDWSEEKNHGYVRSLRLPETFEGPVCGGFVAENVWVDPSERPLMEERRRLTLYAAGPDRRLLDYEVTFVANHGEVRFGDTKEAGLLSFRVATSMDGARGGTIENAHGGRGEKECWGKRSAWCDYSGMAEGKHVGIAVLDSDGNFRHPVHWHVRDYGLMTTNPFGTSTFEGDGGCRGEHTLCSGESIWFHYRVLIHRGDARTGRVSEAWQSYANPPTVRQL